MANRRSYGYPTGQIQTPTFFIWLALRHRPRPCPARRRFARRPHETGNVGIRKYASGPDRSERRAADSQPPPKPSPQIKRVEPQRRPQERLEKPIALRSRQAASSPPSPPRSIQRASSREPKSKIRQTKMEKRKSEISLKACRSRGPGTLLCAPKDPENDGVHTKRKAACVATSGPSLGRKRPRRAAIAGALPHTLAKTIAISGSIERR